MISQSFAELSFDLTTHLKPQQTITMKSIVAFALFVAVAVAVPVDPKDAVVTQYENDNIGVEGYKYSYGTSDGKSAFEYGQVKDIGTENEGIEVAGEYTYTAPDGVTYNVKYTAGRAGFKPEGAHLPVA